MNRRLIVSVLGVLTALALRGQILEPGGKNAHLVSLDFGYDHNLVSLNFGYSFFAAQYRSAIFADFTQGTALLGTGNFRTQAGLKTWFDLGKALKVRTLLALVYTQSRSKTGAIDGLGFNLQLNPGITWPRGGIGADLQYNRFLATHFVHSDFWRQYYYKEVKDGWYRSTSANLRTGIYLSSWLGRRQSVELHLRGGYQTNGKFDKLIPKFYGIIGLNKKL